MLQYPIPPTPGEVELWLQLAEKYGLSLVLLAVFMFAAAIFGYFLVRWLKKIFEVLLDRVIGIKNVLPDPSMESVEIMVHLNLEVRNCLITTMNSIRGSWAQLWSFHNGIHGLGTPRVPFMYLGLTHQTSVDGSQADLSTFSALPLSWFDDFIVKLMRQETVIFTESPDITPTPMGKMIAELGAKTAIARAIRDRNGQIIGVVMILWKTASEVTTEEQFKFLNGCMQMTAILSSVNNELPEKALAGK